MEVAIGQTLVPENKFLVVDFNVEVLVPDGILEGEEHPPVKGALPTICAIVHISLLDLSIKLALDIEVDHVGHIVFLGFHLAAGPNYHSQLELVIGFGLDVEFFVEIDLIEGDKINPEPDATLADSGLLHFQVVGLDRIVKLYFSELGEHSVFGVDYGFTYKLVDQPCEIFVPDFDGDLAVLGKGEVLLDQEVEGGVVYLLCGLVFELCYKIGTDIYLLPILMTMKGLGLEFNSLGWRP